MSEKGKRLIIDANRGCLVPLCIAVCAVLCIIKLDGIRLELRHANELKTKELDIKIVQTDLARRQYMLDSARFDAYRREH